VQSNVIESIVQAHLVGKGNYTVAIHKLLTIELIHRLFIDRTNRDWSTEDLAEIESLSQCRF